MKNKISVVGSGAWGTAIAQVLASNDSLVSIFSIDKKAIQEINQTQSNSLLPDIKLSANISATDNFEDSITNCAFIFIVVPSGVVLEIFNKIAALNSNATIIICSKGIESSKLQLFSEITESVLPQNNYAILSGPNFADETANALPTITSIASKDKHTAQNVENLLNSNNFSAIISQDVIGAQIYGAVKNILAIGCGIVEGLNLGMNAKAALITKGTLEMNLLIKKISNEKPDDFISAAGLGDLFLTCSSAKSRNNTLGSLIGKGQKVSDIVADKTKTYEGFSAASSIIRFSKKHQIKLPLCESINQILENNLEIQEIRDIVSKAILSN